MEFPHWHEAEVGAPARRAKPRLSPEGKPPFPALRWPNQEEAEFYGYPTLKDWYVDYRQGDLKQDATRAQINGFETEFRERANQAAHRDERDAGEKEAVQPVGEPDGARPAEGIGPSLGQPVGLADVEPLAWKRVENHTSMRGAVEKAIKAKWAEATSGPPCHLKELLEGTDQGFRQRLLKAQGECKELKPLIEASRKLLGATRKESVKEAEATAKDYRLNPEDAVLERAVLITRVRVWVPVMPTTVVPAECFGKAESDLAWRRYAFELSLIHI